MLDFSLADNLALPNLPRFTDERGLVRQKELEEVTERYIAELGIRSEGPRAKLSSLSGGNQQKVMLAKWLATSPKVLIVDEPTIGVDIKESKEQIRSVIRAALEKGVAVIMLTTELDELALLAHRAVVMFRGSIAGRLTNLDSPKQSSSGWRREHRRRACLMREPTMALNSSAAKEKASGNRGSLRPYYGLIQIIAVLAVLVISVSKYSVRGFSRRSTSATCSANSWLSCGSPRG